MKSIPRILLLVIGLLLFAAAVHSAGVETVWSQTQSIGWRVGIVLAFYPVIFGLDTWGWHFSFPCRLTQSFRWRSLFGTRLAGEALNYITPLAALGGEPIKAQILKKRHQISWSDGLASLVIAKTSFALGLVLLILSGLGAVLLDSPLSNRFKLTSLGLGLFFTLLIALFWFFQQGGFIHRIWVSMRKWIPIGAMQKFSLFAGRRLDRKITHFYETDKKRFALSVFFHFLGWACGIVEVYLIFNFLGVQISWAQAWILESLLQLVKALSFAIPAALGTQEGGALLICGSLGLGSASGVALALIRRFREIIWAGIGLLVWFWMTIDGEWKVESGKWI